jgi:hypothetical protein
LSAGEKYEKAKEKNKDREKEDKNHGKIKG